MKTKSLDAVTATGAGLGIMFAKPVTNVTLTVYETGTPTSGVVELQVTQDRTAPLTWVTVATYDTSDSSQTAGVPVAYASTAVLGARANCTTQPGGGSSPTLTAHVVGT